MRSEKMLIRIAVSMSLPVASTGPFSLIAQVIEMEANQEQHTAKSRTRDEVDYFTRGM
jgi:hypothetical protein